MTSESFKVMYEEVVRGFESICGGFYVHHCINRDQSSPNLFPDALSNRFLEEAGRLRMWARNVGAHRQGKVSLDHRLREASQVRSMVAQILQDIKRFLNQGKSGVFSFGGSCLKFKVSETLY